MPDTTKTKHPAEDADYAFGKRSPSTHEFEHFILYLRDDGMMIFQGQLRQRDVDSGRRVNMRGATGSDRVRIFTCVARD